MTEPLPRRRIHGWEFLDHGNLVAYTQDPEFADRWLAEVKAGDWGPGMTVRAVGHEGETVDVLWPES